MRQSQSTIQKSKNQTHFSHLAPAAEGEVGGFLCLQVMGRGGGRPEKRKREPGAEAQQQDPAARPLPRVARPLAPSACASLCRSVPPARPVRPSEGQAAATSLILLLLPL